MQNVNVALDLKMLMHNLYKRMVVVAIGAPMVCGLMLYAPYWLMLLCLAVVAFFAVYELNHMSVNQVFWFGSICIVVSLLIGLKAKFVLLYLGIISWLLTLVVVRYLKPWPFNVCSKFMCFQILIGLYAAWLIWLSSPSLLLNITLLTWVSDSVAYLVGSKYGKRKFVQSISPNKTLAGFVAALVCGVIWIWLPMIIAIMLVLAGIWGDLFESVLKRSAGVKDSSQIFPGHGGLLDRLDSLIATWFVGFICLQYKLV